MKFWEALSQGLVEEWPGRTCSETDIVEQYHTTDLASHVMKFISELIQFFKFTESSFSSSAFALSPIHQIWNDLLLIPPYLKIPFAKIEILPGSLS